MRSKQNSKKVSKKLFTILFTKKGSHYDSLRARLGNKREKPGLANVVQVEVFIVPPTESIDCGYNLDYILYSRLYNEGPAKLPDPFECYFLGRIKSFQMPKANRLTINPIAIIPTIGIIISFLLLYYMKSISRIQPKMQKCFSQ